MSRWLADACALIGFYTATPGFPPALRSLLENDTGDIAVLATTVWEIAIKARLGKLPDIVAPGWPTLADMLAGQGYALLPLDPATAEQAAGLPPLHGDPFDRALVAVAQRTGRIVLTSDATIGRYGVSTRW